MNFETDTMLLFASYNFYFAWIFEWHFQIYSENVFHKLSHSVTQLKQLIINLKIFEKNFFKCFYSISLTWWKYLCICIIWLSKLIEFFWFVFVLFCIWKIKLNKILYNLHNNVCLICFRKHNCNYYVLKLCRNCTSDFDDKFE